MRLGKVDAVLNVDRVDIGVRSNGEADGQCIAAIVAAGRLHVDHVVDANDPGFDRLGDGLLNDFSTGAGIADGYGHLRRHDVRKLGNRYDAERDKTCNGDDERYNDRKPWPIDENTRQHVLGSRLDFERLDNLPRANPLYALGHDPVTDGKALENGQVAAFGLARLDTANLDLVFAVDDESKRS